MAPNDNPQLSRELGELSATQREMLRRLEQLEVREERRDAKIDSIYGWMQQAQGSWKTMVMCGGLGAAVMGVLGNLGSLFNLVRGGH
jgi:hypothetical protein